MRIDSMCIDCDVVITYNDNQILFFVIQSIWLAEHLNCAIHPSIFSQP